MNIQVLKTPDPACDAYIQQNLRSKMSHTLAWSQMIERAFGHKPFYLVARDGGQIQGVLPLMQIRSRLFGNRMISQAFSNYGGPLADNPTALKALYNYAVQLATDHGCEDIEFRNTEPLPYDLHTRNDKLTMVLSLTSDPDELWQSFDPKVRNQIRKAKKSGLISVHGRQELLDDFWHVWSIRMSQLGTPCYPPKLFYNILETFPENTKIFLVRLNERTIGGAFVYCFKGFVQMRWAAALVEYNELCPNNLLYWSVMQHYCLTGASCFDFGRTTVGGTQYKFKKQWGSQQVRLYYQYWSAPGHNYSPITPDNPKYRKKVEMWKKLPLCVTRLIGPHISSSLP